MVDVCAVKDPTFAIEPGVAESRLIQSILQAATERYAIQRMKKQLVQQRRNLPSSRRIAAYMLITIILEGAS